MKYSYIMEPTDLFRKTLALFLEEKGRGSQKELSDETDIPSSLINDFIKGRKAISETKKNDISKAFGFVYEEFIALGRRLFQSDDPWLWALRLIYNDEKRYAALIEDTGFPEFRFRAIFDIGRAIPLMPEDKPIILAATGFTEEDFIKLGQREILKNPKMKWDLGGMTNPIGSSMGFKYKESKIVENQTGVVDEITREHFEIVKKFKYKDRLKKINEDLLIIEQNPDALRDVEAYLRGLAAGIKYSSGHSSPNQAVRLEGKLKNGTED